MTMLRVRVDAIHDNVRGQIERWLNQYGQRWLLVYHEPTTENPHYHVWLDSKYKEVTLRMSFRKYVTDIAGNKDFALQKCDPERYEEYLVYMFNRKLGNRSTFVNHVGVDDWEDYQTKSKELTDDYLERKQVKSKNDIVTFLLSQGKEYGTVDEIFDEVMVFSKANGIILSVNAIREIIIYVGYNGGDRACRGAVRASVLKIFS